MAGCSSGGGGASGDIDVSSAKSIAAGLVEAGFACTGYTDNPQAIGPKTSGSCTHDGDDVTISTFESAQVRDAILESFLESFGASFDGTSVLGDAWHVTTSNAETAKTVADVLGGEVK